MSAKGAPEDESPLQRGVTFTDPALRTAAVEALRLGFDYRKSPVVPTSAEDSAALTAKQLVNRLMRRKA